MVLNELMLLVVLVIAAVGAALFVVAVLAAIVAQVKLMRARRRQEIHTRLVVAATNALALAEKEAKEHDDVDVPLRARTLMKLFAADLLPKVPRIFGFNPAALDTWLEAFLSPAPSNRRAAPAQLSRGIPPPPPRARPAVVLEDAEVKAS